MIRVTIVACACAWLAACSTASYQTTSFEGDPAATEIAQNQYSLCLTESAARLDDGRSELAAIGNSVASACYPQFVQIQQADGDATREEFQREYSPASAALMHKQDEVQQAYLAEQAVLAHRHVAANATIPTVADKKSASTSAMN
jgi:hypothetical protein